MKKQKIVGPLGAALCGVFLVGCPGGEQGAKGGSVSAALAPDTPEAPKPGAATPEEAYAQAKQAVTAGEWKKFYDLLVPSTRDKALGGMVFAATMMAGFSDDAKKKEEVEALSKKHGIGEPNKERKGPELEDEMARVVSTVTDKPGCFADYMAWLQANAKEGRKLELGTVERVTITGDAAIGYEVTPRPDGTKAEKALRFERVDGRWFMDVTYKEKRK